MTRGGTILLVEDEEDIASIVRAYLEREGFRVVWASRGTEGLQELERNDVRLAILDLQLPDTDGFELCKAIRSVSSLPVVMLTARDEEIDRVTGLELGADDYVTKPFSPRELAARVRAVLRRTEPESDADRLAAGDVVLDRRSRTAIVDGVDVELTAREFDLVWHLAERPGVVVTRERILDRVWGLAFPGGTRTVDVHVGQIRREARSTRPDPHGARHGVQAGRVMRLALAALLGIAGTVVVSLVVTVVAGALLTRRSLESTALGSLERQVELIATQRRQAPTRDVETELGRFLATEEQRLAILTPEQAELLLPEAAAARLEAGRDASGKVGVRGTQFLYAARRSGDEAIVLLRPAASQAADWTPFALGLGLAGLVGAALAALVALLLARAVSRPVARVSEASRALADGRAARPAARRGAAGGRDAREPRSTISRASSTRHRTPSAPSCSRSATS